MMRAAGTAKFQYQYHRHYKKSKPEEALQTLTEVYIELVNYCNLRCIWCALDHNAQHERMELSLFEAFLQQHQTDQALHHIQWIHLHNGGETLLHPQFVAFLTLLKTYKDQAQSLNIPFPKVSLLSNGTVYNEKIAQALSELAIVDLLRFSMDGGSPSAYEEIRHKAQWDKFVHHVEKYLDWNKKSAHPAETGIICLLKNDQKPGMENFHTEFAQLLQKVDDYEIRYAHDWAGEIALDENSTKPSKTTLPAYKWSCNLLLNSMVLMPKGQVTACCADLNAKGMIGWFPQKSLREIFLSQKRLHMLQKVSKGRHCDIELCKNCEGF